jgi:radical SAM protein with 4Fe4S-binding SPASM domain
MTDFVRTCQPHELHLWRDHAPLLGHLDIELTERCNNACIHCLINQPEHDPSALSSEMDTSLFKDVLRQAAELGCLSVRFTGGEPLLRHDFEELYVFVRRLGMRVILFTNARLVTDEIAQLLSRIPPGHPVEVTVYGMHSESYDAVTAAPGAYTEFRIGLEHLKLHRVPVIVKSCILPQNRLEMDEFEAFAATFPRMDRTPTYAMHLDLRARRDNPAKNRLIEQLRLTPEESLSVLKRRPDYWQSMRAFSSRLTGPIGDRLFGCSAGRTICVDAYGYAHMCLSLRHPGMAFDLRRNSAGNESRSSLRFALTEFFPRLRETRADNSEYLRRCARCFLKGLCEQCPVKSWIEHGTLDTPVEYLCRIAHSQARYLGLLQDGEDAWEIADWRERIEQYAAEE